MSDRIQTLHPEPDKVGVNIERVKYDTMRAAIRVSLEEAGELSFTELTRVVGERLDGHFDGSIGWYVTTVKLDLEARGELERIAGRRPQHIRLTDGS